MKKNIITVIYLGLILGSLVILEGCQKDAQQEMIETFVRTQVNCNTYEEAGYKPEALKNIFLEFFTEESYETYLKNLFGYLYPEFFKAFDVKKCDIHQIKILEKRETDQKAMVYIVKVEYMADKMKMNDYFQMKVGKENKINEITILNTSDIIKKMILDIKVQ